MMRFLFFTIALACGAWILADGRGTAASPAPGRGPESRSGDEPEEARIHFMILDPGHFHAALVLKTMPRAVSPAVDVYAPEGSDLDDFLRRVRGYNDRVESPTHWDIRIHSGPDFLERFLVEKPGNVVVLAGNNRRKTETIRSCAEAGVHVLADKPMCIDGEGFALLERAFHAARKNRVLLYDIMTERYEITNLLQRELMHVPAVFGILEQGTPDRPAVVKESVHHFSKVVSGSPVKRPAWFFDTTQQGEGVADVTTHLVDLVQWGCFPDSVLDFRTDIRVGSAKRRPTLVSPAQFEKVTGLAGFPDYLRPRLDGSGSLPVYANGEIVYRIRGHWAKVSVLWNFEAPAGGGDTHFSIVRGTKANLVIRQGKEQSFRPELTVEPTRAPAMDALEPALVAALHGLSSKYPGLGLAREQDRWRVTIPDSYRVGHEAHFGQVADAFLSYVRDGALPAWEVPGMLAKYHTTTTALEMALRSKE